MMLMAIVPFSQPKSSRKSPVFEGLFGNVSILDRLDDFRKRMVRSCIAVALGVLAGFSFVNRIVAFVLQPTRSALPEGSRLIYTQPGEAFSLYIQIALIVGVVLAMPYVMFQLWRLIAPLVPESARRFAIPFAFFTTLGFV